MKIMAVYLLMSTGVDDGGYSELRNLEAFRRCSVLDDRRCL